MWLVSSAVETTGVIAAGSGRLPPTCTRFVVPGVVWSMPTLPTIAEPATKAGSAERGERSLMALPLRFRCSKLSQYSNPLRSLMFNVLASNSVKLANACREISPVGSSRAVRIAASRLVSANSTLRGRFPVPVRATSTVDSSGSSEVMRSTADFVPAVAGVKATATVQEFEAEIIGSACPQEAAPALRSRVKSAGFAPVIPIPDTPSTASPGLPMVTVPVAELPPMTWPPKSRDGGLTSMSGVGVGGTVPPRTGQTQASFQFFRTLSTMPS